MHICLRKLRKNATENVVCRSPLLNVNGYVKDFFRQTDKQFGPRSDWFPKEQSDLDPHRLLQRRFKRNSRRKSRRKNASENVVCLSLLLHVNDSVKDYFRQSDKQLGPRSDCLLQTRFKRNIRRHTDDILSRLAAEELIPHSKALASDKAWRNMSLAAYQ